MFPHATLTRLVTATFAAAALGAFVPATASAASDAITITASNYKFTPNAITVHVGQPVTLALVSSAGVHGIASSDLGIAQTTMTPGGTKNVTFTPSKVGKYVIHCTIPCGPGHNDMVLTVQVVQ